MRRLICMLLTIVLIVGLIPFSALGYTDDETYTEGELRYIEEVYKVSDKLFYDKLYDDSTILYWQVINNYEKKPFLQNAAEIAGTLSGVKRDEKHYAEILQNYMLLMNYDFDTQVEKTNLIDNVIDENKSMLKVVELVAGIALDGEEGFVQKLIGDCLGSKDVMVGSAEEAKYYFAVVQNYTNSKNFLEAVYNYSDNDELCSVAKQMLNLNEDILEKSLEYIAGSSEELGKFEAKYMFNELMPKLIKETDTYKNSPSLQKVLDPLIGNLLKAANIAGYVYGMGMVVGDLMFGTTNTFTRLYEMQTAADIAEALIAASNDLYIPEELDSETVKNVFAKSEYYKLLISIHARGDYLLYQLAIKDSGLLSQLRSLMDDFKDPEVTWDGWYNDSINTYKDYYNLINTIYDIKDLGAQEDSEQGDESTDNYDSVSDTEDLKLRDPEHSKKREIVLVLDHSGSMEGEPLQETHKASENFIDTVMEDDTSVGIVTYEDEATVISNYSKDRTYLKEQLKNSYAGGGTNIDSGLSLAHEMLRDSKAEKKIIVLMSDGEPNYGRVSNELISYADEIRRDDIIIYTLGFFEELYDNQEAQALMEGIASEGHHYEVSKAEDLKFFFGDMAEQLNGQKYMYIRIACPVDVIVEHAGEKLDSGKKETQRTKFGTLTFEQSDDDFENEDEVDSNLVKVLRLKEGDAYDVKITGTDEGSMNYTIGFMDKDGNYSDMRSFENVEITDKTVIDTVAEAAGKSVLKIDEDGDGSYDCKLQAKKNSKGEEVNISLYKYIMIAGFVWIALLVVISKIHRRKTLKMLEERKC